MNDIAPQYVLVAIVVIVAAGIVGVIWSPANTVQILGFCTLITVSLLALLQRDKVAQVLADKVAGTAEGVAEKVTLRAAELKSALAESDEKKLVRLEAMNKTVEATHQLVNSGALIQLRLTAVLSRRLAELTKAPEDALAADRAEELVRQQEVLQQTNPPPGGMRP